MSVLQAVNHTEATILLNQMIVARYGDDPAAFDDLSISHLPCPHQGSDRRGHVISAWPRAVGATADNLLCVYYGDDPIREDDC
jgi:hypothetical protein